MSVQKVTQHGGKYISIYVPGITVVKLGFFLTLDADLFNAGETVYPLSECGAAEIGQAC